MRAAPQWRAATVWMMASALVFFLGYGFANWVTAQRSHVPSIAFGWEHSIPFMAWTIVPYWSTDLLYALSFFLCLTRHELKTYATRLIAAQVISVVVFLAFPLRFAFEQPHTAGVFGFLFQALGSFDKPFNQAPSLHLSLITILWAKYSEHLRGIPLLLLRVWLAVSGLSTLTTYQHHFIDLPTGIWVGLFCMVLFPVRQGTPRPTFNRRTVSLGLGSLYLTGAVALVAVSCKFGGIAWGLLWPAGALLIVALAYWSGSPQLFRNHDGEMNWESAVLLAPYLAAARVNSRFWTRNEPAAQEILTGIWLGRSLTRLERECLQIASVVDLAPELPIDTRGITCRGVPILDLTVPAVADLDAAVRAIEGLGAMRPTLVCCAVGCSRSAAAMVAWLIASRAEPSVDSAIELVQKRRRRVVLSSSCRARLEEWSQTRSNYAQ